MINFGIGQNLYYKDGFGFTVDFRGLFYKGPDPLSVDLSGFTNTADPGLFKTVFSFNLLINVGIVKLF